MGGHVAQFLEARRFFLRQSLAPTDRSAVASASASPIDSARALTFVTEVPLFLDVKSRLFGGLDVVEAALVGDLALQTVDTGPFAVALPSVSLFSSGGGFDVWSCGPRLPWTALY